MSKSKNPFPTTLFIVHEIDGGQPYFIASESEAYVDIDNDETRLVATYTRTRVRKIIKKVALVEVK
jgi:hypothetical protein